MKKPAPTLIDALYRASFRNESVPGWRSNAELRTALQNARRFALDDGMSTFLGQLSTEAFANVKHEFVGAVLGGKVELEQANDEAARYHRTLLRLVENLRQGAILPHASTWVEYDLRLCQTRANVVLARPFEPDDTPRREGWLVQQHPHLPTAYIAHLFADDDKLDHYGYQTWTFPFAIVWTVDQDTVLPWRTIKFAPEGTSASALVTGIREYLSDRVGYVHSPMLDTRSVPKDTAIELMREWSGVKIGRA